MENLEVRIVRLEPAQVAYSLGFGPSPEAEAWNTLLSWAGQAGLLKEAGARRFFGFNNPDPTPGSPNYGYEQWMTLSEPVQPGEGVKVKEAPGGLYAVARCRGTENIFAAWQGLVAWIEQSPYQHTPGQCLEECLNPELLLAGEEEPAFDQLVFDLYSPVTG